MKLFDNDSSEERCHTFGALIISGIVLGLISLFLSTGKYGMQLFAFYLTQPLVLFLNCIPFVLFCFFFFAVFNRVFLGVAFSGVLCLLYSLSNYWKLLARGDPVYAEDLTLLSEAAEMSVQYINIDLISTACVLIAVVCILLCVFVRGRFRNGKQRGCFAGIAALISVILYFLMYTNSSVYDSMSAWPKVNEWFPTSIYVSRGGIYPFIYSIPKALSRMPDGYDKESAEEMLTSYVSDDIPEDQKVSVISVMLEAYSDFSLYTDAITSADPYEYFHQLQEESLTGMLVTNAFAADTFDTERSFLTGFSSLTDFRFPSWSYVRYFAEQGYQVSGAHAGYQGFYNRSNVNSNLGFTEYRFIDNYYSQLPTGKLPDESQIDPAVAYYLDNLYADEIPMDYQMFADLIEYYKKQMESGPVFSFNLTYQNHGPYPSAYPLFYREYVPKGNLSESDYNIVNNYLAGIEETSIQIKKMVDAFRDYEKPVIFVFFGDHKPWLGDQGCTYASLGIDIESDLEESFYNYYTTEYMIWANDVAKQTLGKEFTGTSPAVSPCYLMNILFQACGWEGPSFLKLSNEIMEELPVIHSKTARCVMDGQIMQIKDLPEEKKQLVDGMQYVQYYLTYDSKGTLPG